MLSYASWSDLWCAFAPTSWGLASLSPPSLSYLRDIAPLFVNPWFKCIRTATFFDALRRGDYLSWIQFLSSDLEGLDLGIHLNGEWGPGSREHFTCLWIEESEISISIRFIKVPTMRSCDIFRSPIFFLPPDTTNRYRDRQCTRVSLFNRTALSFN